MVTDMSRFCSPPKKFNAEKDQCSYVIFIRQDRYSKLLRLVCEISVLIYLKNKLLWIN